MIKLVPETAYGEVPDYASVDDADKVIIDAKNFKATLNKNIIYEETLYEQDAVDGDGGIVSVDGSVTIPVRMSQFAFLNKLGLGGSIDLDLYEANTKIARQSVALPTSKLMPNMTLAHLKPKPEVLGLFPGTVFSNYKLTMDISKPVMCDLSFNAMTSKRVFKFDDANIQNYSAVAPLPPNDLVRSLDLVLYGDVELVPFDEAYAGGRSVIEAIYTEEGEDTDGEPDGIPNDSAPTWLLVGDIISNVKSMDISCAINTFSDDAHRMGSVFAAEYPMRKVKNHNFSVNFSIDDIFETDTGNEYYNRFVNGATLEEDGIIEPTECGVGKMSLVAKMGSSKDMAPLANTVTVGETKRNPWGPTRLELSDLANPLAPVKSAPNRTTIVMPNVLIESTPLDSSVGAQAELAFTARILADSSDGIFKDLVVGGESLINNKLAAFTINRI